jgi:hypothetical protein
MLLEESQSPATGDVRGTGYGVQGYRLYAWERRAKFLLFF